MRVQLERLGEPEEPPALATSAAVLAMDLEPVACQTRRSRALRRAVDLTPRGIRDRLGLDRPIYARTAAYGHFGRPPGPDGSFSWEREDLAAAILASI